MHKLNELRQKVEDLKGEGREILAKLKAGDLDATQEGDLQQKLTGVRAEIERVGGQIKKLEELAALDAEMAPVRVPDAVRSAYDGNRPPEETGGFRSMAEFGVAVRIACTGGAVDPRLAALQGGPIGAAPTNFHQEAGSEDGYMVPPAMRQQIWEYVFDGEDVLNMLIIEPTASNSVEYVRDESLPWDAQGIQARWEGEGQQLTPSKLSTQSGRLNLHKLNAFVLATDELLEDAPRLGDRLTRQAGRAIRWRASDAVVYGTGAGMPLGYMVSPALVSVPKEGGQAADTIVTLNILNMFARMIMIQAATSFWLANSDTLPQLGVLTIGNQPVWTPVGVGMRESVGGSLLGRPLLLNEHAKTLGDQGDLQLVNPTGYYAVNKAGGVDSNIRFAQSIHLFFDYSITAFRWTFRMGGQPFASKPVDPPNSPNLKSFFVALDERA